MSYPIQVTFLNMHHSDLLEDIARNYAEKLSHYYSRISRVKIAIEVPHKNHTTGNTFQVKIDIAVPGTKVCIATNADSRLEYRNIKVALRDAFLLAKRRLEDYAKRKLDAVKRRAEHASLDERRSFEAEENAAALGNTEEPPYDLEDLSFIDTDEAQLVDSSNVYTQC